MPYTGLNQLKLPPDTGANTTNQQLGQEQVQPSPVTLNPQVSPISHVLSTRSSPLQGQIAAETEGRDATSIPSKFVTANDAREDG
jgi:hypothetical protein